MVGARPWCKGAVVVSGLLPNAEALGTETGLQRVGGRPRAELGGSDEALLRAELPVGTTNSATDWVRGWSRSVAVSCLHTRCCANASTLGPSLRGVLAEFVAVSRWAWACLYDGFCQSRGQ